MYAVVQHNDYGAPTRVHAFAEEKMANEYLEKSWWTFLCRELEESAINIDMQDSFIEENHARISWANSDVEEWDLVEVEEDIDV